MYIFLYIFVGVRLFTTMILNRLSGTSVGTWTSLLEPLIYFLRTYTGSVHLCVQKSVFVCVHQWDGDTRDSLLGAPTYLSNASAGRAHEFRRFTGADTRFM